MLLGIDQGTSGTACLALSRDGETVAQAYRPLESRSPRPGWVEQDPGALLCTVVEAVAEVLDRLGGPTRVEAVGLANQGESVIAWARRQRRAAHPGAGLVQRTRPGSGGRARGSRPG